MHLNRNSFAFLLPILVVLLVQKSSDAASLTYGNDGRISFSKALYLTNNKEGEVFVRYPPRIMPKGGTPVLRRILKDQFPEWTFYADSINGNFEIDTYYPCSPATPIEGCGLPVFDPAYVGVGATFRLTYKPSSGDPKLGPVDRINWIQRVKNNHRGGQDLHGLKEDGLDNPDDRSLPYYYVQNRSTGVFADSPARGDVDNPHYWIAELFLTKEVGSRQQKRVAIYEGVRWGWGNNVKKRRRDRQRVPACPVSFMLVGGVCQPPLSWGKFCVNSTLQPEFPLYDGTDPNGLFGYGCDWRPIYADNSAQASRMSLPEVGDDLLEDATDKVSVPEPSVMGMLAAVGVWGGISWRKRKQNRAEPASTDN